MKPQKMMLMRLSTKEWPLGWKRHLQVWLVDAAVMMVGAWILLVIWDVILRIMATFLR